jgi:hypothetical protein
MGEEMGEWGEIKRNVIFIDFWLNFIVWSKATASNGGQSKLVTVLAEVYRLKWEGVVLIHFSFIHDLEKSDFRILKEHHLIAVYYNHCKSNLLRIQFDDTQADLNHQLSQTQRASPLRLCKKGDRCRVLPSVGLLKWNCLVQQHETSKRWRYENNILYFLLV